MPVLPRQLPFGASDPLLRPSHVLLNRALELSAAVARRRADHLVHLALDLLDDTLALVLCTVFANSHGVSPWRPSRHDDQLQTLNGARSEPCRPLDDEAIRPRPVAAAMRTAGTLMLCSRAARAVTQPRN